MTPRSKTLTELRRDLVAAAVVLLVAMLAGWAIGLP